MRVSIIKKKKFLSLSVLVLVVLLTIVRPAWINKVIGIGTKCSIQNTPANSWHREFFKFFVPAIYRFVESNNSICNCNESSVITDYFVYILSLMYMYTLFFFFKSMFLFLYTLQRFNNIFIHFNFNRVSVQLIHLKTYIAIVYCSITANKYLQSRRKKTFIDLWINKCTE